MAAEISNEEIARFRATGLLDETAFRNHSIRKRYKQMQSKGHTIIDIEYMLSDEFYLSPESIHRIRYDKATK